MPQVTYINHVTVIVDNLEKAIPFYEHELGLEKLPAYKFDYPAQFFRVNGTQQIHLTEWEDTPSFRGHMCLQVNDFAALFRRMKQLGAIDIAPWGKVHRLPDGTYQMFIRDPSGNLIEISAPPEAEVDPMIFEDELCERTRGTFASHRDDSRGMRSDDATLYHGREET